MEVSLNTSLTSLNVARSTHFNPDGQACLLPLLTQALTLDALRAVFLDTPLLHRYPCAAVYDKTNWKLYDRTGSNTQAKEYARNNHRPGPGLSDMCASDDGVFSFGAPPSLKEFPAAWGGFSCFIPVGALGRAAWRYAHETIERMHESSKLLCRVTTDPAQILESEPGTPATSLRYVFGRSIGSSRVAVKARGVANPLDHHDEESWTPLAHHVLVTVSESSPTALLDKIALCEGWDVCAAPQAAPFESTGSCADGSEWVEDNLCIQDQLLGDIDRVLDYGLVHRHVPPSMCLEALLYSFFFHHHQAQFSGRAGLDRILALDGGRCAELILAAAALEWPGGNYGKDAWASGSYAPTIVNAARAFISQQHLR